MATKYKAVIVKRQYQHVEFEIDGDINAATKAELAAKLWDDAKPSNGEDVDYVVEWVQVVRE
jgi:hypothetical protein